MRKLGTCCSCGTVTSTGSCGCGGDFLYNFMPPSVTFSDVKFKSGFGPVYVNSEFPSPPSDCQAASWTLGTSPPDRQYRSVGTIQLNRWDPASAPATGGIPGVDYPSFPMGGDYSQSECWYVSTAEISTGDSPEFYIPAYAGTSLTFIDGYCSQTQVGGFGFGFWGRDIKSLWWHASTDQAFVTFKYAIYPEYTNLLRSQITNPPPASGSTFVSVLIGTHEFLYPSETPWINGAFPPYANVDAVFTPDDNNGCNPNFPQGYLNRDVNVAYNDFGVEDSTISIAKDIPCACWFNDEGGGCNPFTADCNDNPVSNLILTRDGNTTVTQNADSYWENVTTIRIPVDTDMGLGKFYIDMRPAGQSWLEETGNPAVYGAGNFIECYDNGLFDGERYQLDSCEGNIRGTNIQNPNTFITFDENNWSDCRS